MRGSIVRRPNNEDLISELPKDVLDCILERMPLQYAVKTSALSRKWRYNWVSIKTLIFDLGFFCYINIGSSEYMEIVHNILLHHNGALDKFSLYTPYADDSEFSTNGNLFNCLKLVSRKCVKDLTIKYHDALDMDDEVSNTPLYTCVELTHLGIMECGFFRPPTFRGFPNLVKLECTFVNFCGNSFEFLMSSSPLLEHLTMTHCTGPAVFNICSASLKHLEVTLSAYPVNINAENLETLCSHPNGCDDDGPVRIVSTANLLKKLSIDNMDLGILDGVFALLGLIHRAPNLQKLEVLASPPWIGNDKMEGTMNILELNMNQMLDKLQFVKIRVAKVSRVELFLIKRLLALSPSLENMVVELRTIEIIDGPDIRGKMMGFPRVSPKAQLSILD